MGALLPIIQLLLTSVVQPLIEKYQAENANNPNLTDAQAVADLKTQVAALGAAVERLRQASGG